MSGAYSGREVLVTGGTSGIGRAIAEAFAAEGAEVLVTGLTETEVSSCRGSTDRLTSLPLDVADQDAIDRVVSGFKRMDVLVNAAGMILRGGLEFEPEGFCRVVDVNLTGTMRVCRACRNLLAESGGSIVNLASMLSVFGSGLAPRLQREQGRSGPVDQVVGDRLGVAGDPGQRHRPRLDPHGADPAVDR